MGAAAVAATAEEGDQGQELVATTARTSQMPPRVVFDRRGPRKLTPRAFEATCGPHSSSSAPPVSSSSPANRQ